MGLFLFLLLPFVYWLCSALSLTLLLTLVALFCRCQSQAAVYFSTRLTRPDETAAVLPSGNGSSDLAHAFLVVESKVRIVVNPAWHISAATMARFYAGNSRVTTTRLSKSSVVKQPLGLLMPQL